MSIDILGRIYGALFVSIPRTGLFLCGFFGLCFAVALFQVGKSTYEEAKAKDHTQSSVAPAVPSAINSSGDGTANIGTNNGKVTIYNTKKEKAKR